MTRGPAARAALALRPQLFAATLAGLAPAEVRKAKLLYLRNAAAELDALAANASALVHAQGCFTLIPLFWPIRGAQRRLAAAQLQLARDRFRNALHVWRDDLRGERFTIGGKEITA